ncbi:MAG: hypothetical protein KIG60_01700 [Caryophanon sp.]|nr:hypothetical protein [Caryophanon sp.]
MDDKRLDEKLDLLGKSYDRMPRYLDVDALMNQIDEEEQQAHVPVVQKPKRRIAVWGAAAVAIFACGVLVGPMLSNNPTVEPTMIEQRALIDGEDTQYVAQQNMPFEQFEQTVRQMRQQQQQLLALPDAQFNALPYVQQADAQLAFYAEQPARYEQTTMQYLLESFEMGYASPTSILQAYELFQLTESDVVMLFLERMGQLKAAYRDADAEADEQQRALMKKAAKAEAIELKEGTVTFSYEKFRALYDGTLQQLGLLRGLMVMAQFEGTLFEVDDLRYAPEQLLPYYDGLTLALLSMDETNYGYDLYYSQFILATLRLLQGTEQYPLSLQTLQFFIDSESGVFRPLAEKIAAQLQQFGYSEVAQQLTYDDVAMVFRSASLPYTSGVGQEETWVPTAAFFEEAAQKWETVPSDLFVYSGKETVLYYVYAVEHHIEEVYKVLESKDGLRRYHLAYELITSIRFTTYGEDTIEATITEQTQGDVTYMFMKINDVWQRVQ